MPRLSQLRFPARVLLVAATLFQSTACTGEIDPPTPEIPTMPDDSVIKQDRLCPTMIPDQDPKICPRLKNITLSCGGNGMLHTSIERGSGNSILLGVKLDDGSVFSGVLVLPPFCQDGPREGVTLGLTYTGQVATSDNGPPCIAKSKAVYSQFQFGDPIYAGFEGLAKDKLFQTLDDQAITNFASTLGLAAPATSRCSKWRELP